MSMLVSKERTVFVGDVNIHENPSETQIEDIAFGTSIQDIEVPDVLK